jgi:hypothetical protein
MKRVMKDEEGDEMRILMTMRCAFHLLLFCSVTVSRKSQT